jgi:hypothetical protein
MGRTFELDVWTNCTKSPGETRIECASIQITLGGNDTWLEGVRESYRRILALAMLIHLVITIPMTCVPYRVRNDSRAATY